jgi:muramoyltetrapeptide carboxypeptidase
MASPKKPNALRPGARIRIVSPASPAPSDAIHRGMGALIQLGYQPETQTERANSVGYFSSSQSSRFAELTNALNAKDVAGVIASRGGYGSTYLLADLAKKKSPQPKIFCGFSDTTAISCFLWKIWRWVSFYGPMAAAGFDSGADAPGGFECDSFTRATTQVRGGWKLALNGEPLCEGHAGGILLGGCLTLLQTSIGTPWELDTRGAILAIEDRGVRPYQVDRMLMHLLQAGKFRGVRGIVLGEFPDCDPLNNEGPTVREVCSRILEALKIPVVWGAPVGHTKRAMLTLPLGVRAKLTARGGGTLEILEPAVKS